jgi:hypothetical protein
MYEMYPDAWTARDARGLPPTASDRPRRRARKEHSVTPPVISVNLPPDQRQLAGS